MSIIESTFQHDGKSYVAKLARVTDTHIGYEDHGILSINIQFEGVGGGWGQGTGHRFADRPNRMFPWVKAFIDFFGKYGTWEAIKGQEVYILSEDGFGAIEGLAHKTEDRVLLFHVVEAEVLAGEPAEVDA